MEDDMADMIERVAKELEQSLRKQDCEWPADDRVWLEGYYDLGAAVRALLGGALYEPTEAMEREILDNLPVTPRRREGQAKAIWQAALAAALSEDFPRPAAPERE